MYDCIVIGGGHNGLVTAAYLARTGKHVCVLERKSNLGGCACTQELWPGFKASPAAYVISLFLPQIIKDLRLRHDTRHYELMIFLQDNELTKEQVKSIHKICPTPKTKPSEIARQANEALNKKIITLGYTGIPDDIKFIGLDEHTNHYRFYIPTENDY